MSKIFTALKKAQGELAWIASPVIEMAEADGIHTDTNGREPDVDISSLRRSKTDELKVEAKPQPEPRSEVRRLALRLPAHSVVLPATSRQRRVMEEYRMIRTKIVQHPKQPKLIAISSAGPGDGKTVNAVNIACTLALRDNARVLLVDADLRRPSIGSMLGMPETPGLADVLEGTATLQESIVQTDQFPTLYVIPAGQSRANATELLDSAAWKDLCSSTKMSFDYVIVDTPPVGVLADFELIQATSDGVILMARPNHTDLSVLRKTFELVSKDKLIGMVVNCSYDWFLWKTHGSYYYGYYGDVAG